MRSVLARGMASGQVSDIHPSNPKRTPLPQTSFLNPYGLTLRQTITSSGSVTIPAGITWVYVIMTGAGAAGGGGTAAGGNAGSVTWGWTLATNKCVVGASSAGFTRYGHLIALGGNGFGDGGTNYYGMPGGVWGAGNSPGGIGINGGGNGRPGGDGISGGCGANSGPNNNGGHGLVGGGGGSGGSGGNGRGIDGTVYLGATAPGGSQGGGGAGLAGNASGSIGGLGGGGGGANGAGGAGIIYLFY